MRRTESGTATLDPDPLRSLHPNRQWLRQRAGPMESERALWSTTTNNQQTTSSMPMLPDVPMSNDSKWKSRRHHEVDGNTDIHVLCHHGADTDVHDDADHDHDVDAVPDADCDRD